MKKNDETCFLSKKNYTFATSKFYAIIAYYIIHNKILIKFLRK
jgi:hypothetical protein